MLSKTSDINGCRTRWPMTIFRPNAALLLFLVRATDERGEDLDQHVVAAEPEGCCLCRHARRGAFKLVREDGAAGGRGGRHHIDKNIDAGAVERGQPARLHEHTLPMTIYGSYKLSEVP